MIEPLYYKLNFSDFYPSDDFFNKYYGLESKKQDLIHNILERLYFIDIAKENEVSLINKLVWNLRLYLLLSSSDALGAGANYYSFDNYLNNSNISSKNKIINDYSGFESTDKVAILDLIKCLYKDYNSIQSVKQSFQNFWQFRSGLIKEKLTRCMTCLIDNSFIDYSILINEYFYKLFRNGFTHSAMSNLPELADIDKRIKYNKGGNSDLSVLEVWVNNEVVPIITPVTYYEFELLKKNNASFYVRRIKDDEIKQISPNDYDIHFHINANFGYIHFAEINEKRYAINSAIVETLKLSVIEGMYSLIGIKMNWEEYYNKKYFV